METGIPGLSWDESKLKGFKAYELRPSVDVPARTGRRDFYKMGLVNGDMTIDYGGQIVEIKGNVLFFVNPKVSHSIVRRVRRTSGYACIFTDSFIKTREFRESPLFSIGDDPVIPLNEEQTLFIGNVFRKMLTAYKGDYLHKAELIKNCIALIIHEALNIQPPQAARRLINGTSRIAYQFIDLLEKQFPIERSNEPLKLRNPQDFAASLAVHVNYLNRAVKTTTGKPTSAHIAARIIAESKALLKHTDWSIADIAYALGFEYPAYFNNYFKRITGTTPNSFRKV